MTSVAYPPVTGPILPGPAGPPGPSGPQGPGGGGGRVFYVAHSIASDVQGYRTLLDSPSTAAEQSLTVVCSDASDVLIGSYVTAPGVPGSVVFPAGTAFRRFYASVSGGSARLHVLGYSRSVQGIETLVRDEFSNPFSDTVATLQEWIATPVSGGQLSTGDRVVNKVYAQRVSGPVPVQVTVYFEGSLHASQIQTTIPASIPTSYVHTQSVLAATWTVVHNLAKYPAVAVVDSGDSAVIPDVHYDSTNQVTLTFGAPTSGRAFVN